MRSDSACNFDTFTRIFFCSTNGKNLDRAVGECVSRNGILALEGTEYPQILQLVKTRLGSDSIFTKIALDDQLLQRGGKSVGTDRNGCICRINRTSQGDFLNGCACQCTFVQ